MLCVRAGTNYFHVTPTTLRAGAKRTSSNGLKVLALAAGNEAGIGKTGLAIRLTEPDAPPIFAHVLPLTGSDFRTRLQPSAVAAVFIGAPPDAQDGADAVAAAFGLTLWSAFGSVPSNLIFWITW
jgi:hypothetical protein